MNYFISPTLGVPPVLVTTLRELDFRIMLLQQGERNPIKSKVGLGLDFIRDSWYLFRQRRALQQAGVIVVNSYVALSVLLLHRLGLIRYRKLIYFGFFLHAPRYFPLFRMLFRMLLTEQDMIQVFSQHELMLYQQKLGLKKSRLVYAPLPYQPEKKPVATPLTGRLPKAYFFAGGYTNRDYAALIQAFAHRTEQLVICGSSLNHDLPAGKTYANITVFRDLPRKAFKELVAHAQACLLPVKDDTGAAGQSFVLEAMAFQKVVIATQTHVLTELIDQNQTGFLLADMRIELPLLLRQLQTGEFDLVQMGREAHNKLIRDYSDEAFAHALAQVIRPCLEKQTYQKQ
ncbi:glycosyltransferase [Arsenicibacter rosenii]|uniref:Glycosyl transferase family 1 domain-containing protein n=1 Tax=Arsenicibacter rosenii TaxID=1750698 RepID=A0A1S2VGA8_9BACT|nr:glycosyltransferase [Arsenicibacter rosenii]OIN57797.1 hypothetical protein BLX24_16990 [Arsenicibacter rosenii]